MKKIILLSITLFLTSCCQSYPTMPPPDNPNAESEAYDHLDSPNPTKEKTNKARGLSKMPPPDNPNTTH